MRKNFDIKMKMNFAYNLILNYSILNPKLILKK